MDSRGNGSIQGRIPAEELSQRYDTSRRTFTQQMKKDKFSLRESLMITKAP
jgi:hypothetical protein